MSRSAIRIISVVLALCGLVATGSGSGGSRDAGTVRLSDELPRQLVGTWRRNVTPADFERAGAAALAFTSGSHSIVVKRSGDVNIHFSRPPNFTAGFSALAGRRLIIDYPVDCLGRAKKGLYRWKVAGRLLTLKKLFDRCPVRVAVFAGVWKRK